MSVSSRLPMHCSGDMYGGVPRIGSSGRREGKSTALAIPKSPKPHSVVVADEYVLRLDVSVDDLFAVGLLESSRNLGCYSERLGNRERSSLFEE